MRDKQILLRRLVLFPSVTLPFFDWFAVEQSCSGALSSAGRLFAAACNGRVREGQRERGALNRGEGRGRLQLFAKIHEVSLLLRIFFFRLISIFRKWAVIFHLFRFLGCCNLYIEVTEYVAWSKVHYVPLAIPIVATKIMSQAMEKPEHTCLAAAPF